MKGDPSVGGPIGLKSCLVQQRWAMARSLSAGKESYVLAHLSNTRIADILREHIFVMASRMAPAVELFERSVVIPSYVFHAHSSARSTKSILKSLMTHSFLAKHIIAMLAGQMVEACIELEGGEAVIMPVVVDQIKKVCRIGRNDLFTLRTALCGFDR